MKNQKKRILLADQLSTEPLETKRSTAIRLYAGKLAKKIGEAIDLLCVENLTFYPDGPSPFKVLVDAFLREQTSNAQTIAKSLPVAAKGIIINGDPTKEIIAAARKRDRYELIIVGTSGRKGVQRMMLGSVAEEVIRNVQTPVMTIGPNAESGAVNFLKSSKISILIPTSLTKNSLRAEAYGIDLAKKMGADGQSLSSPPEPFIRQSQA